MCSSQAGTPELLGPEPVEPGILLIEVRHENRAVTGHTHPSGRTGVVPYPNRLALECHPTEVFPLARFWIVTGDLSPIFRIAGVVDAAIFSFLNGNAKRVS